MPIYRFPKLSELLGIPDCDVHIEDIDPNTLPDSARSPFYGQKHDEETKARISASKKGKPSHHRGRIVSPEERARVSAGMIGRVAWNKGLKLNNRKRQ